MDIHFRNQLTALRKAHHLSQEQLAEQLSVTRQTISKWELGTATPDLARIEQIAHYFDVPAEELLFGKGSTHTVTENLKNKVNQFLTEDSADKDWHEQHRWRHWYYQPIHNGWEFLARYYWILFGLIGMFLWFLPSIIKAFR